MRLTTSRRNLTYISKTLQGSIRTQHRRSTLLRQRYVVHLYVSFIRLLLARIAIDPLLQPTCRRVRLIELPKTILDVLFKERLVVAVPARQSRAALRDVARTPHDAQLVHLATRLVVRADYVELALADLVELLESSARHGGVIPKRDRVPCRARSLLRSTRRGASPCQLQHRSCLSKSSPDCR